MVGRYCKSHLHRWPSGCSSRLQMNLRSGSRKPSTSTESCTTKSNSKTASKCNRSTTRSEYVPFASSRTADATSNRAPTAAKFTPAAALYLLAASLLSTCLCYFALAGALGPWMKARATEASASSERLRFALVETGTGFICGLASAMLFLVLLPRLLRKLATTAYTIFTNASSSATILKCVRLRKGAATC